MTLTIALGISLVLAATITVSGVAMAQDATVPPPPPPAAAEQTSLPARAPSLWMIGGLTTLAFSYAPAAMVGGTSGLDADRALFVPVLGPWIDLAQRPACPGGACSDKAAKELLVFDGALQAASALAVLLGLVSASPESAAVAPSESLRPTLRVSPAPVGAGGHGVVALGTF